MRKPNLTALFAVNLQRVKLLTLTCFVSLLSINLNAQCTPISSIISGHIYNDMDFNGIEDISDTHLGNIVVAAFDSDGVKVDETISNSGSGYTLSGLDDGEKYRIEFTFPSGYELGPVSGFDQGAVRIVTAPACDEILSLHQPLEYCETDPDVALTCFVKGPPSRNGLMETIVSIQHSFTDASTVNKVDIKDNTGSVFGIVFRQKSQEIFSSAFVKQYASLTTHGPGAIFKTKFSSTGDINTTLFTKMSALGIDVGTLETIDQDECAYGFDVGKVGLGDLALSEDSDFLYVTNQYDNTLIEIPVINPTASNIRKWNIPDPGCTDGDFNAFAVEPYNGKIYIGGTCTGETSMDSHNSEAVIYEFDTTTGVFDNILQTDYIKGFWKDDMKQHIDTAHWVTDLAFTDQGYMVIGLTDRIGHTYCNGTDGRSDQQFPDVLVAWNNNGTWTLENNGTAGSITGSGANNGEGPGGGEFFEDFWPNNPLLHPEILLGTFIAYEGKSQLIATAYDPLGGAYSGGILRYNTADGSLITGKELYNRNFEPFFGKATGFGDLDVMCGGFDISIGNLVWLDENNDGIQNPNEVGIAGLELCLHDADGNIVGTTTTDSEGGYLFDASNVDLNNDGTTEAPELNECYYVIVCDTHLNAEDNILNYEGENLLLSNANVSTSETSVDTDLVDNDATVLESVNPILNGATGVKVFTGGSGDNDYSVDLGFTNRLKFDLALRKILPDDSVVELGQLVVYDIWLYNQGNVAAQDIFVVDYIGLGYEFDEDENSDWRYDSSDRIAKIEIPGILEPGDSTSVSITLTVNENASFANLINLAEIVEASDALGLDLIDCDSTPDDEVFNDNIVIPNQSLGGTDNEINDDGTIDEDDHDFARVDFLDLALKKVIKDEKEFYLPGEDVTFEIIIYNQGTEIANNITIVDYLPENMVYSQADNPGWKVSSDDNAYFEISEELGVGETDTIFITLKVDELFQGDEIVNRSEISNATSARTGEAKDFDSEADNFVENDLGGDPNGVTDNVTDGRASTGDEDDADPAKVKTRFFDLALMKMTTTTVVEQGGEITFQIGVLNQGSTPAKNIKITDYLPTGTSLSDANWTAGTGNTASITLDETNSLSPLGLLPGSTAFIDITIRIGNTTPVGELVNYAEISGATDEVGTDMTLMDIDSRTDAIGNNDAGGAPDSSADNHKAGDGTGGIGDGDPDHDEDDHDPENFYVISKNVGDSCTCVGYDAALMTKYYTDLLTVEGPCSVTWTEVLAEREDAINVTPIAPVMISATICKYDFTVLHDSEVGFSVTLESSTGEKQVFSNYSCPSYSEPSCSGALSLCVGGLEEYRIINPDATSTYTWSLPDGGGIVSNTSANGDVIEVTWSGLGDYRLVVVESNQGAGFCGAPHVKTVKVGNAGGSLSCHANLNFSLDENCELEVTPEILSAEPLNANIPYQIMLIDAQGNVVPNNILDASHIGQQIEAKLIDGCSGNTCWGYIIVEDKLPPVFTNCPTAPIVIECEDMPSYIPEVLDACDGKVDLEIVAEEILTDNCDQSYLKKIKRTYIATDKSGNRSATCEIELHIKRPDLAAVDFVQIRPVIADLGFTQDFLEIDDRALTCDQYPTDENGNPDPSATGFPHIVRDFDLPTEELLPLWPAVDDGVCKLVTTYSDVRVEINCKIKIIRTWIVVNDCLVSPDLMRLVQTIEIVDPVPPTIECPHNFTVTTDGYSCEALVTLPVPVVSDNCSEVVKVQVQYDAGFIADFDGSQHISLPAGRHRIDYGAFDECDNENWCWFYITVEDHTPPIAICDRHTVVGLVSQTGEAKVGAYTFDDGSFDDCELDKYLVRRMDQGNCDCDVPNIDGFHYLGEYRGHNYFISKKEFTGPKAYKQAAAVGGYPVVFDRRAAEKNWVRARVAEHGNPDFLLGLSDVAHEGVYEWANGDASTYRFWLGGNPTGAGDYVMSSGTGDRWVDYDGLTIEKQVVIEVEDLCGFSDEIKFCCEDSGAEHQVVFRVIDKSGNYNDCMVTIEVQDKVPPQIFCPENTQINCTQEYDLTDLSEFGEATATDVCDVTLIELDPIESVNSCGVGSITRRWTASDGNGSSTCSQVIDIVNNNVMVLGPDVFPKNQTLTNQCTMADLSPDVLGTPDFDTDHCNLIGVNYEDDVFPFVGSDACLKILRTWTIINWCAARNTVGSIDDPYQHVQIIKVNNTINPVLQVITTDFEVCTFDNDCEEGYIELEAMATDDCTPLSDMQAVYTIDYDSDGTIDVGPIFDFNDKIDASGTYPIGTHTIVFEFEDRCGNKDAASRQFTIKNCKAPSAACIGKLTVTIEPWDIDGDDQPDLEAACIYASQFDASSSHPCGYPVTLSFSPDAIVEKDTVGCGDVGVNDITIYVHDPFGNVDQCMVSLCVQNNDPNFCPDPKECIIFPEADLEISACLGPDLLPETIGSNVTVLDDCGMNLVDYVINHFDVSGTNSDGCALITRTFVVFFNGAEICRAEQRITVLNDSPPIISCLPSLYEVNATSNCSAFVDLSVPNVSSVCNNGITITNDSPHATSTTNADGTYPVGETQVTYTVTDACGNVSSCTVLVRVTDGEAPVCNVDDITISLGADGTASVSLADLNISGSDACGGQVTTSIDPNSFDCNDLGSNNTVTVVVRDGADNSSTCTANVTITDELIAPICRADDITIALDANGNATISATDIGGNSRDGCNGTLPNLDIDITDLDCTDLGVVDVVLTVSDVSGNESTCTAQVTVEDKTAPVCNISDVTVSLTADGTVTVTTNDLNASATDVCDPNPTLSIVDNMFDCDDLGDNVVVVTVTDDSGNSSTCTATVTIVDETSVPMCVAQDITIMLSDAGMASITAVDIGGASTDGCNGATPNLEIDKTDFTCLDIGQVNVTLTVTDDDGNSSTCTATVTVEDPAPPECNIQDITVSLAENGTVSINFSDLDNGSADACGQIVQTDISPSTFGCDEEGVNTVTVTVTDDSGNSSTCSATVTVVEGLAPVCMARDNITVALDENGQQLLTPDLVDAGSFDPCGDEIDLSVNPEVIFCNDIGDIAFVFTVTDSDGVMSTCEGLITVIDTIAPRLTCPVDLTIGCDVSIANLEDFGLPAVVEECAVGLIEEEVVMNINRCNIGFIERTFTVSDGSGNISECTQVIRITGPENPITLDDITFPSATVDLSTCASLDPSDLPNGVPVVDESDAQCSLIGVAFTDNMMTPANGEPCPTDIIRSWTVVDSCQLNGDGVTGIFTFDQTITVNDTELPVITGLTDVTVNAVIGLCEAVINMVGSVSDCDNNLTITNDSQVATNNNSADISGTYAVGVHNVTVTATDFCGNEAMQTVTITVVDNSSQGTFECKKIVRNIEDNDQLTVNAEEIVCITQGGNCAGGGLSAAFSNDITDTDMVFDCSQAGDSNLEMFIFENGALLDRCFVVFTVRDPGLFCLSLDDEDVSVTGKIITEDNEGVENVEVGLDGAGLNEMTDENGDYAFPTMPTSGSYEVMPTKNDDVQNGVSTLDIILIQKHILNTKTLDSPYKIIAADVNNSQTLSVLDLVDLRKVILGINEEFPNNTSWRMVDADYEFVDETKPLREDFSESYMIENLDQNMLIDFVGVKVGDVNGSANPNNFVETEIRTLPKDLELKLSVEFMQNNQVAYHFYATNYDEILGFQFSLGFDENAIMYQRVIPGAIDLTDSNIGSQLKERGLLTFSYNDPSPLTKIKDDKLFTLVFDLLEQNASPSLSIGSDVTSSEAYSYEGIMGVSISYLDEILNPDKIGLYQNSPNPWSERTNVTFYLPKAMDAELIFFDVTGRKLHTVKGNYDKGFHNVEIGKEDFTTTGLIYYELRNKDERLMHKMLLLK